MCGPTTLFVGQVGDWTWETVSLLCGTNVFKARTDDGAPTYLAFYYLHLQSSGTLHPGSLGFGDRLEVVSQLFDLGSESILALHRLRLLAEAEEENEPRPLTAAELHQHPADACLYVESFNRWVARSRAESNEDLLRASPVGFRHRHLPPLAEVFSPRLVCQDARRRESFLPWGPGHEALTSQELRLDYALDLTRDLNAVGLVYFATFFSILDRAVLHFHRHLGRSDAAFLARVVLDQKICFLANAEPDAVLTLRIRGRRLAAPPAREAVDVVFENGRPERPIAVATVVLRGGGEHGS